MPKPSLQVAKPVDQLSQEEVDQLYKDTLDEIAALRNRWRGLVQLTDKQRENHPGRNLGAQIPALSALFSILLPNKHDDKEKAASRTKLANHFDAFGDKDGGTDPERFEPDLLVRRIHRIGLQQKVADELGKLSRLMSDDVLHTSEVVLVAGSSALDMVRTLSAGNATYSQMLAPVTNALRDLTKAARAKLAQLRDAAAAAAASETPAAGNGAAGASLQDG